MENMPQIPSFDEFVLKAICNVLGDTSEGFTGSQIGQLLEKSYINDPLPGFTKRDRLFEALNQKQKQDGCANNIVAFLYRAISPVLYTEILIFLKIAVLSLTRHWPLQVLRLVMMENFEK